ncbi:T9SS type A sorting domain-containing protein [Flammeovirga sp. SubArs3]|uniref:T9SS type A sorting domain-containing protein n=1 Tax=Flammeovirga sp. SubArs3 TaxID=2995316 RepID=UPI00248A97FA|nr:T9SS type A sorting domain-containing protein [Flammeovirga sp. SubArs3]
MNYILQKLPIKHSYFLLISITICLLGSTGAYSQNVFQHLSSYDPSTIVVDELNNVTEWKDISGNDFHATTYFGQAVYPSLMSSYSGVTGVDFGLERSGLTLLSKEEAANVFDFDGAASTNSGFSVMVAFQIEEYHNNWSDLIGNTSNNANAGFGIRYGTDGEFQIFLGGQVVNIPGAKARLNHSIVVACNYDATTGELTFWDSQNLLTHQVNVPKADFNFDQLYLGSFTNGNRQVKGMVGEVKIYNEVLADADFKLEYSKMRDVWHKFILPIEVIGAEQLVEHRSFHLSSTEVQEAKKIWLQINNLSYENKVSVKVNDGSWYDLNHSSVDMALQAKARGGMQHGGYNTIHLTIPANGFMEGLNTVYFRFNRSDAISNGFRVVKFNLQDANKENLLLEDFFYDDDPEFWVGPYTDDKSIKEGEELWREGALWSNYLKEDTKGFWYGYELLPHAPIQATCADCHTQDGRDLELFSYSNKSIIERSVFHNLTEDEGRKIASYIRSLKDKSDNINRHGRPWNPPYQPGPQLKGKSIEYWAAGAGLEAVLEKDEDMLPYMFPNGVNKNSVQEYFNQDTGEDRTTLPLALQFPDWKHWLPMIHPKDAFTKGTFYEDTYKNRDEYKNSQESLLNPEKGIEIIREMIESLPKKGDEKTVDMSALTDNQLAEFREAHEVFRYNFRFFQSQGGGETNHWRSKKGNGLDALDDNVPQEFAATSMARLMAVKNFEIMQEFNLQDQAQDYILSEDNPNQRQWFHGLSKHVFEVPAHITGCLDGDCQTFGTQPEETGQFESTSWYHLQAILAGGEGYQWWNGPVDYNYQPMFILRSSRSSNLFQPLRYYHSLGTLYKTKTWSGDLTPNDGMGFRIRVQGPWYFFGKEGDGGKNNLHGFEPGFWPSLLDEIEPGLAKWVLDAQLREFLKAVRKHDIANWQRWEPGMNGSNVLDPIEKSSVIDVTLSNDEFPEGDEDEIGEPLWADHMYWVIGEAIKFGVDCEIIRELIDWSEEAWPNIDWSFEIQPRLQLKLSNNAEYFRDVRYVEAMLSDEGNNPEYVWYVNGQEIEADGNRLLVSDFTSGDIIVCHATSTSSCLDLYSAKDTIGVPGDLNIQMSVNQGDWENINNINACIDDQIDIRVGFDIEPLLWVDASTINGIEDGTRVTQWEDQSENNNDLVAWNTSIAPKYSSSGFNGLPALSFGATESNSLTVFGANETDFLDGNFTIFLVQQIDPIDVWSNTLCNKNSTEDDGMFFRTSDSGKMSIGGGNVNYSSSAYGLPTQSINTITREGQEMSLYTNGFRDVMIDIDENDKLSNNDALYLGQFGSSSNQSRHHKGYIAEVLIFDRKLTTSEQEMIEGYLAHKWNLDYSLSSTNRYKFHDPLDIEITLPTTEKYNMNNSKRSFSYIVDAEEKYGELIISPQFSTSSDIRMQVIDPNAFYETFEQLSYQVNHGEYLKGNDVEVEEGDIITFRSDIDFPNAFYWTSPSGKEYSRNENPSWTSSFNDEEEGIWVLNIEDENCFEASQSISFEVKAIEKIVDDEEEDKEPNPDEDEDKDPEEPTPGDGDDDDKDPDPEDPKDGDVTALDTEENYVKIYPNPSHGKFRVSCNSNSISTIVISNYLGLPLKSIYVDKKSILLDIQTLNPGVYLLKIQCDNNDIIYRKIIKY